MPLRVTVEVIPNGDVSRTETIGRLYIVNLGGLEIGHQPSDKRMYGVEDTLSEMGDWTVDHRRSKGAWALVAEAIKEMPR